MSQEPVPQPVPISQNQHFFDRQYVLNQRIKGGWPMSFELRSAPGGDIRSDVGDNAASRGVRRLCHFTKLSSLRSIHDLGLLSQALLEQRGLSELINDPNMRHKEGHQDWVRASVEYPNLFLLDDFKDRQPNEVWIVLLLDPKLLSRGETTFADHNAATENGARIKDGSEGFDTMYASPVTGPNSTDNRQKPHLDECPTSLQAEVLIRGAIDFDDVIGIVVRDEQDRSTVSEILEG